MTAINEFTLYPKFVVKKFRIGSTQYKQEDCSPMLTQVHIKTHLDKRFRPRKDFFGENASTEAYSWIQSQMTN